jgi:hypothetical protein
VAERVVNENLETSLASLREHRDDMARWLAVEVLLTDPAGLVDDELRSRLEQLQERMEDLTRERYAT